MANSWCSSEVPQRYHDGMGSVLFIPYALVLAERVREELLCMAAAAPATASAVGAAHGGGEEDARQTQHRAPQQLVLETACGTGIATAALRDALSSPPFVVAETGGAPRPGAAAANGAGLAAANLAEGLIPAPVIMATDLSPSMLQVAAKFLAGDSAGSTPHPAARAQVRFAEGDMTLLQKEHAADGSVDVVACQFGVMFPADKAAVFSEVRRVLRVGGAFIFFVWDTITANPAPYAARRVFGEMLGIESMVTPFSMHDPAGVQALVRAAGLQVEVAENIRTHGIVHDAAATSQALCSFLLGNPDLAADPTLLPRVEARLAQELQDLVQAEGGSGRLPLSAWLHVARKVE